MTPTQRKPEVQALWEKLEGLQLNDNIAVYGFASRLAKENGWSHAFAGRVILEYKRFLLLAMQAGHPATPSEAVDQAWHLHLIYTRSYWDRLCGDILGRPLHHEPTVGGIEEKVKFHQQYLQTLESYERFFGMSAPADIWPLPKQRSLPRRSQWVDISRQWLLPKPNWLKFPTATHAKMAVWLMLGLALLVGCQPVMKVLDLRGHAFLRWYAVSLELVINLSGTVTTTSEW